MLRDIESGPVQEEPEQQINLEGENQSNQDNGQNRSERMAELESQIRLMDPKNVKELKEQDKLREELGSLRGQEAAEKSTEEARATTERSRQQATAIRENKKAKEEEQAAREELDRAFRVNNR